MFDLSDARRGARYPSIVSDGLARRRGAGRADPTRGALLQHKFWRSSAGRAGWPEALETLWLGSKTSITLMSLDSNSNVFKFTPSFPRISSLIHSLKRLARPLVTGPTGTCTGSEPWAPFEFRLSMSSSCTFLKKSNKGQLWIFYYTISNKFTI